MASFVNVGDFRNLYNTDEVILPYSCKRYWVEVSLNKIGLSPFMKYEKGQKVIDINRVKIIKELYKDAEIGSVVEYSVEFLNPQDKEAFSKRGIKLKGKFTKILPNYWILEED